MKNRYERLSKKERKEAIKEFRNFSTSNNELITRLKRLKGIGIIGIIYSILMFILDYLKETGIFDYGFNRFNNILISYIIDGALLVFCAIFVIKANQLLSGHVNKYLIEKNKPKAKKKK